MQIPLPSHTSLKKVDIFVSDLILRVTSLEKKQTHFIDLVHEIDYRSPDNKFLLTNGLLHATLKKASLSQISKIADAKVSCVTSKPSKLSKKPKINSGWTTIAKQHNN